MPNSILWIGLVVLWVFVLFPMLAGRHPRVRRTTDAALATRVLHRGGGTRRRPRKGSGGASVRARRKIGHSSSLEGHDAEDRMTPPADEPSTEDAETSARDSAESVAGTTPAAGAGSASDSRATRTESEPVAGSTDAANEAAAGDSGSGAAYSAVDPAVLESGPRPDPDGGSAEEPVIGTAIARIPPAAPNIPVQASTAAETDPETDPESNADADPVSGESDSGGSEFVPSRRGRGGYDPEADAVARATRYRFRQRTALGVALSALLFGAFAMLATPLLWWAFGVSVVVLGAYLVYLRKQVRVEEEIRRRRAARLSRPRPETEDAVTEATRPAPPADRSESEQVDAPGLRRRAVVLEVDDEDPYFEPLDPYAAATARTTRHRAAGGEIRRAAGE